MYIYRYMIYRMIYDIKKHRGLTKSQLSSDQLSGLHELTHFSQKHLYEIENVIISTLVLQTKK